MNNSQQLDENQKLLVDAFKLQNEQAYDEALQKLQLAGENLINIIQKIQSSPQFYMRYMQLMKDERQLISEKDYKQFLSKNEKVLSRNFEKNAYLALLMQEMQEKQIEEPVRKLTHKEEALMKKMMKEKNCTFADIEKKFSKISKEELAKHYESIIQDSKQDLSLDIPIQ